MAEFRRCCPGGCHNKRCRIRVRPGFCPGCAFAQREQLAVGRKGSRCCPACPGLPLIEDPDPHLLVNGELLGAAARHAAQHGVACIFRLPVRPPAVCVLASSPRREARRPVCLLSPRGNAHLRRCFRGAATEEVLYPATLPLTLFQLPGDCISFGRARRRAGPVDGGSRRNGSSSRTLLAFLARNVATRGSRDGILRRGRFRQSLGPHEEDRLGMRRPERRPGLE